MEGPLVDPDSTYKRVLDYIDIITTAMFTLESAFKIIASGFLFNGPWSYLRKMYNILDFVIVVLSLVSFSPASDSFSSIKMLRIFRAMRLISKNDGLKVALSALFQAIPNVANVTIIMLLFFLLFGVIAVSFFKGKEFRCIPSISSFKGITIHKWDCLDSGGEWVNREYNFDSVPMALVSLFVYTSTDWWSRMTINALESS